LCPYANSFPARPDSPTRLDDCDERLRAAVLAVEPNAVDAALALMERYDPETLREAVLLAGDATSLNAANFDVVAEAWDRYFHMRHMSWD
jgi:hypothetical protein